MSITNIGQIQPTQETYDQELKQQGGFAIQNKSEFLSLFQQLLSQVTYQCPHCGESSNFLSQSGQNLFNSSYTDYTSPTAKSSAFGFNSPLNFSALSTSSLPMNTEFPRNQNVSMWPQTVQIQIKNIGDGKITWDEIGDRSMWPIRGENTDVNANMWIIRETAPGQYKADTWEYVRNGQTTKTLSNINDMGAPEKGERVGFMLAGVTRNEAERNIEARSNVTWATWPG